MPEHSASCMPRKSGWLEILALEDNRLSSTTRDGYFFLFMTKIMETTKLTALIVKPMLVKTRPNDSVTVISPPPFREWPNRPHATVRLFYHKRERMFYYK